MTAARLNYLEHEFYVAVRRNPDDPVREMIDRLREISTPEHQIASYMEELRDLAFSYFKSRGREDLIHSYGIYSAAQRVVA